MQYTYDIFERSENPADDNKHIDTGCRPERITLKPGQFAVITDERNKKKYHIESQDELDEWLETAARAFQWSDAAAKVFPTDQGKVKDGAIAATIEAAIPPKHPYNALEETDGFHVKRESEERDLFDAISIQPHLTLGQLKLERPLEDSNVKTAAAAKKPRVAAVPPIAIMALGTAMQTGADKYGPFNWRDTNVTATVFYNAMMRHLEQWFSGEDHASDTNVHHLAHVMAGGAIMLDAMMNGVFIDDRPKGQHLGDDYVKYFMKVEQPS